MLAKPKVYFDTDCFHHFAATFANTPLPGDLRERIVLSPVTMMEMLSHVARDWGPDVHKQIRGMKNWLNRTKTMVLPFMEEAISMIGFGAKVEDDGYTNHLQADINTCINAELWELKEVSQKRATEIANIKLRYAHSFADEMKHFRENKLTAKAFTERWLSRFRQNPAAQLNPKIDDEIVNTFNALHEFEQEKLKVALGNSLYNPIKHANDLFDAEQLIYLGDPALHFVTLDKGYLNKVKASPQRRRIHCTNGSEVDDEARAELLIRKVTA